MPGMDGQDMVKLLKEQGRDEIVGKIVLRTGQPWEIEKDTVALLKGRILVKPEDSGELRNLVQHIMEGKEVRDWEPSIPFKTGAR